MASLCYNEDRTIERCRQKLLSAQFDAYARVVAVAVKKAADCAGEKGVAFEAVWVPPAQHIGGSYTVFDDATKYRWIHHSASDQSEWGVVTHAGLAALHGEFGSDGDATEAFWDLAVDLLLLPLIRQNIVLDRLPDVPTGLWFRSLDHAYDNGYPPSSASAKAKAETMKQFLLDGLCTTYADLVRVALDHRDAITPKGKEGWSVIWEPDSVCDVLPTVVFDADSKLRWRPDPARHSYVLAHSAFSAVAADLGLHGDSPFIGLLDDILRPHLARRDCTMDVCLDEGRLEVVFYRVP